MRTDERLTAAQENLNDFMEELQDKIDFDMIEEKEGKHRINVLTDTVELADKLHRHGISWERLIKEVHTLTPRREAGSLAATLSHAD